MESLTYIFRPGHHHLIDYLITHWVVNAYSRLYGLLNELTMAIVLVSHVGQWVTFGDNHPADTSLRSIHFVASAIFLGHFIKIPKYVEKIEIATNM